MKRTAADKTPVKKNQYLSDDENVKYKINKNYMNNVNKQRQSEKVQSDENDVRYKFPTVLTRKPVDLKVKQKPKIKVNFWSNKQTMNRLRNKDKTATNRRHTVGEVIQETVKPKQSAVKIRKQVSFLPSPLFSDNHIPMVTVPDDLTIQLNEEEANDLAQDLNLAIGNSENGKSVDGPKRKSRNSITQTSPKGTKRKRSMDDSEPRIHNNDHELEFFTKYVVQKLRRMETNQRIYSENLINTVLMLGQLGELNGKSKILKA